MMGLKKSVKNQGMMRQKAGKQDRGNSSVGRASSWRPPPLLSNPGPGGRLPSLGGSFLGGQSPAATETLSRVHRLCHSPEESTPVRRPGWPCGYTSIPTTPAGFPALSSYFCFYCCMFVTHNDHSARGENTSFFLCPRPSSSIPPLLREP